ncbi:MAG TPA: hypothetical protein VD838_11020 [Anaeromyxobacteraceae bacterium]|nr:hypothetical protein [Anaeromyxobacteraceae bacterium]
MNKTIVLAGLIALATAQGVRAEDPQQTQREASEDVSEARKDAQQKTSEARQDAAKETREAQQDVREAERQAAQETREAKREAQGSQASAQGEQKKHAFEGQQNFDVEGKVQKVSGRSLTIARQELPPVTLQLERYTAIEVDGEKAARTQLRQGQDVQASFNLRGDKPIALEVKAKKSDSGEAGQQK